MLLITELRANTETALAALNKRHFKDAEQLLLNAFTLDDKRRHTLTALENHRADLNRFSKQIGSEIAKGNKQAAEALKAETTQLKQAIAEGEAAVAAIEEQLQHTLLALPNLPHSTVPPGRGADDNQEVHHNQRQVQLSGSPLPHWELAIKHGLLDLELGVKVTGAGFPVYIGKGARLQRALINFFLDQATAQGYTEVQPPILVNKESAYGTGQLPDKEGQMYHVPQDDLYLIPTAEVPITNLYRDVILNEDELPIKCCGYTPCFRREAGSYGAHVRGLNRLHQFDKVEIVQLTTPDASYAALEDMRQYVAGLLDALELPYRTLLLCGGDMGFASAKTYDMEVWSAAQERWLEVSSVSNFETFQAHRLKLRYRASDKKNTLCHTLNGSALALPRIVAALLENNQQPDGRILLPKVLHAYTGFEHIG